MRNKRALINQFLRYPENSAGSIMTIEYMDFHVGTTVGQAMDAIRQTAPDKETINTLYIHGRLAACCWARWRCASCCWLRG